MTKKKNKPKNAKSWRELKKATKEAGKKVTKVWAYPQNGTR
jgi:hypothetical protein